MIKTVSLHNAESKAVLEDVPPDRDTQGVVAVLAGVDASLIAKTWKAVGSCSRRCGGGQQRYTSLSSCGCRTSTKTLSCNTNPCPVNGGWSAYGAWTVRTPCPNTCGVGTGVEIRRRTCTNPAPRYNGRSCVGSSSETRTKTCSLSPCPINGGWSSWSTWIENTSCGVTCGSGTRTEIRRRQCNNPAPQYGGRGCSTASSETRTLTCTKSPCPINGGFSDWGSWEEDTPCGVTCGEGTRTEVRHRQCTNPRPQYGGRDCGAHSSESRTLTCTKDPCPINGGWSDYGSWEDNIPCGVTCGEGTRTEIRHRECTNPAPQYGGEDCGTDSSESRTLTCTMDPCPINGGWSDYGSWEEDTPCGVTCGEGTRTEIRHRECSNPAPQYGGQDCGTDSSETRTVTCTMDPCPINGGWSDYGPWEEDTPCGVTCGEGTRTEIRHRECTNPAPQYGGEECGTDLSDSRTLTCTMDPCPINGGWSDYGPWEEDTPCGVTCGEGTRTEIRHRQCTNPAPQYGGEDCGTDSSESRTLTCTMDPCPINGGWSDYGSWEEDTPCGVTCGEGTRTEIRHRQCTNPAPQYGGEDCGTDSSESRTLTCTMDPCPINGGWSDYGSWEEDTPCGVTCGEGTRTEIRHRQCTNPAPQYGGEDCGTDSSESRTLTCTMDPCPINGGWSDWAGWAEDTPCGVTCGEGTRTEIHHRECTNPAPQYGGEDCGTDSSETRTVRCTMDPCPIHGGWSDFGEWEEDTPCDVTCGSGTRREIRQRECTDPAPQHGGDDCTEESSESRTLVCVKQPCPIHGGWSDWSVWTALRGWVITGDYASRQEARQRVCNNPAPANGGNNCEGVAVDNRNFTCAADQCTGLCQRNGQQFGDDLFVKRYFECHNGKATKKLCSGYWNKKARRCQKFCRMFEIGMKGHPRDCWRFVYCLPGIALDMPCNSPGQYCTCPPRG
ncbi:SCO-spondin-like [Gigantopelta aegis]|uniref:SCO-spondin-like n=1 Tax=Gigantopelta aegis TaxID=1735272 RepID=UPI001B88E68E|nr:SCO-spondin-like [Gigantopelta aegis]